MTMRFVDWEVRNVPGMGRGVFALSTFKRGWTVMRCPYQEFLHAEIAPGALTLGHYVFAFPYRVNGQPAQRMRQSAIVLGEASLINHSDQPNCRWDWDPKTREHITIATRRIEPEDQLFFDYGWPSSEWKNGERR
jgi:hypothetical protein